jgi:hypothetical protein
MATNLRSPSPARKLQDLIRSLPRYDRILREGLGSELRALLLDDAGGLDDDAATDKLNHVIRLLLDNDMAPLLAAHGIPYPRYPSKTNGSGHVGPDLWDTPVEPVLEPRWRLLGFDVGSPIGIPACELTSTADWIEYYARQGFHILTYRTVRSKERSASPEWPFLEGVDGPWEPGGLPPSVRSADSPVPPDWRAISTATPFAAPSPPPEVWQADVADARERLAALGPGYLLIVSVMDCVAWEKKTARAVIDDFVKVALLAEEAGAQAVECHLARSTMKESPTGPRSCELGAKTAIDVVTAVRAELRSETRLLIKLSDLQREPLKEVIVPLASKGLIDGVSGISPVRLDATRHDGSPLAKSRLPGVAGLAIRNLGLSFVERLAGIRREEALRFDIIAMGGVMGPQDVAEYMRLGADGVQTASAARCDPGLAAAAAGLLGPPPRPDTTEAWEGVVLEVHEHGFVARLVDIENSAPDEVARFSLHDVSDNDLDQVQTGSVFRWTTCVVDEGGGQSERRSSVRFRKLPKPTDEDRAAGRRLADKVERAFGTNLGDKPAEPRSA